MLANALFRAEDFPGAAEHYERAAGLLPGDPEAPLGLGHAWYRAGRTEQAARAFERALLLSPDDALPYASLAVALAGLGETQRARRRVEQALELEPALGERLRIDVRFTAPMLELLESLGEGLEHEGGG
jgi:Flp pilus assembly protein TadD